MKFTARGIADIPQKKLEDLIRSTGFFRQKARRIRDFCTFIRDDYGDIGSFFEHFSGRGEELGKLLMGLRMGFGKETRDCILLYGLNIPVFIADNYARQLLRELGGGGSGTMDYDRCQQIFWEGLTRDLGREKLVVLMREYTPQELQYALPGYLKKDLEDICSAWMGDEHPANDCGSRSSVEIIQIGQVLLFQQFHAGIVELGRSKRLKEFCGTISKME